MPEVIAEHGRPESKRFADRPAGQLVSLKGTVQVRIMTKRKIFISFDYTNDHRYKDLLVAWSKNTNIDFSFDDRTPGEIQSDDISRIKAVLTQKIKEADYTLVLVGKDCCREHPDSKEIGYTNWQVYEIEKSKESGNKIIAVKINLRYEMPKELRHAYVSLAKTFSRSAIKQAIDTAAKSR